MLGKKSNLRRPFYYDYQNNNKQSRSLYNLPIGVDRDDIFWFMECILYSGEHTSIVTSCNTNPMSCRQRNSCSILAGCAVGTRCLIANHRFSSLDREACCRREPRYTELNVPSPILRWTSNILSNLGNLCRSSFIWCSENNQNTNIDIFITHAYLRDVYLNGRHVHY